MRLFISYLSMHLKSRLEYRMSFLLASIAQVLVMGIELFTVCALFDKFKLLEEYDLYQLILGFTTMWLGFSIAELIGRGFDNFSNLIIDGSFDLLLIRPRSLFLQILGSDICYEKVARIILGIILYIYSSIKVVDIFTIDKVILLILMLVACVLTIMSLFIIGATLTFYTVEGLEAVNIFTNGTKQAAEYPMDIYNKIIRLIFTFIIPVALINYYPIKYLSGNTNEIYYLFMPLVAIIPFIFSLLIFRIGLRKYTSTGS